MLHKKYVNKGFTLVELLAVIVILAIILVIAVPKIMSVITDSKKSSLETSAKMIASSAEKMKMQKELLGQEVNDMECSEVVKTTNDYESCNISFDGNTAQVSIVGANKFEGLSVCYATKDSATITTDEVCPTNPKYFTYSLAFEDNEVIDTLEVVDYDKCYNYLVNYLGYDKYTYEAVDNCSNSNVDIRFIPTSDYEKAGLNITYKRYNISVDVEKCKSKYGSHYDFENADDEDKEFYNERIESYCDIDSSSCNITYDIVEGYLSVEQYDEYGVSVSIEQLDLNTIKNISIYSYDITGGLDVIIPSEINGYNVTQIHDDAFYYDGINSIVLPSKLKKIKSRAFFGNNISNIIIPLSVIEVEKLAFSHNPISNIELKNTNTFVECAFGLDDLDESITHNIPNYVCYAA